MWCKIAAAQTPAPLPLPPSSLLPPPSAAKKIGRRASAARRRQKGASARPSAASAAVSAPLPLKRPSPALMEERDTRVAFLKGRLRREGGDRSGNIMSQSRVHQVRAPTAVCYLSTSG